MDIRLYNLTNIFEDTLGTTEYMVQSPLSAEATTRIETIGNKVVKFLLTTLGSDPFNSEYGSILTTYTQIAESEIPRIHFELTEDIERCAKFIKTAERSLDVSVERLSRLRLVKLGYSRDTRNRIDFYIEIITTLGNRCLLTVPTDDRASLVYA